MRKLQRAYDSSGAAFLAWTRRGTPRVPLRSAHAGSWPARHVSPGSFDTGLAKRALVARSVQHRCGIAKRNEVASRTAAQICALFRRSCWSRHSLGPVWPNTGNRASHDYVLHRTALPKAGVESPASPRTPKLHRHLSAFKR